MEAPQTMQSYFDLGDHSFPVSTSSTVAQLWFDRGMAWTYGFNQDEAARCFREAARADPDCAMAYWGEAYACGPFYNMTWEQFSEAEAKEATGVCFRAARLAMAHADNVTSLEKVLIKSITQRFQKDHPVALEQFSVWDNAYADSMRAVYKQFPEHPDVVALTAEALVTRTPWRLWDVDSATPAEGTDTLEALEILESGMRAFAERQEKPHLGMLHIYLHVLEMSPTPEKALLASDALCKLSPDNGHLQHMPAHIYVLCGRYEQAIEVSDKAITADDKYVEQAGAHNFYAVNRGHDLMMKMHAAMLSGQLTPARQAACDLIERLPESLLRIDKPYMAMLLEGYYASTVHVPVRFGRWEEIIDTKPPDDWVLYPTSITLHHYARAVAFSATGNIDAAQDERSLFLEALGAIPEDRILGNNQTVEVLAVARQMLDGELCYRQENFKAAFDHLRAAVCSSDNLNFSEPWPWMHPPRHALGALLLEQNAYAEAEAIYRADLGLDETIPRCHRNVENVWSLHGLAECLKHRGDEAELAVIKPALSRALALADVTINASCCCRISRSGE